MKVLNGPIDGRARESCHSGDEGNTSSPQLFGIDGSDKVLLSLIQVGEQRSVFQLKFFFLAHTASIT
jgi:hypothetical protein